MNRRVLELGSYVAPAYAGMVLAEQGWHVTKWVKADTDPILALDHGRELWEWINHRKAVLEIEMASETLEECLPGTEVVLDNFRPAALDRWKIDPEELARRHGVRWISLRAEDDGRSFDIIAQARSTMEYGPAVPWILGDTAAGLWMAFKATCDRTPGHHVLRQASVLQKLVEGELVIDRPAVQEWTPWDAPGTYGPDGEDPQGVRVVFRGETVTEPVRDRAWKLEHLDHVDGRIRI